MKLDKKDAEKIAAQLLGKAANSLEFYCASGAIGTQFTDDFPDTYLYIGELSLSVDRPTTGDYGMINVYTTRPTGIRSFIMSVGCVEKVDSGAGKHLTWNWFASSVVSFQKGETGGNIGYFNFVGWKVQCR